MGGGRKKRKRKFNGKSKVCELNNIAKLRNVGDSFPPTLNDFFIQLRMCNVFQSPFCVFEKYISRENRKILFCAMQKKRN